MVQFLLFIKNVVLSNMAKDKDYIQAIHTRRWLELRRDILTNHPLCERCLEEGRVKCATEVHHVVPVEEGVNRREKQSLMFNSKNLRALCHDCHVLTHIEMGRCGRKANEERKRRQSDSVNKRFFE